jgi:hypothetical protein
MITLTERDHDLLETLTLHVRLLTVRHCAWLGWPDAKGLSQVQRRLQRLAAAGLVELHRINAHPLPDRPTPLFTWEPGASDPDPAELSRRTRERWSQPAQPTEVCVASPLAAGLLGSTARGLPPLEHRDHDLCMAGVYVHYRRQLPKLAAMWIGEHALPKAGYRIKDPDAFLRNEQGKLLRVIESAGRYGPRQFESFHQYCDARNLPYELW